MFRMRVARGQSDGDLCPRQCARQRARHGRGAAHHADAGDAEELGRDPQRDHGQGAPDDGSGAQVGGREGGRGGGRGGEGRGGERGRGRE